MNEENIKQTFQDTKCHDCGAMLKFQPGSKSIVCEYCGANNQIDGSGDEPVEEQDFHAFLAQKVDSSEMETMLTVKCSSCAATTTLNPNVTADDCPFCGTALVIDSGSTDSLIKPKSLLPFKVTKKEGLDAFKKWIKKLWFAPSKLKKYIHSIDKLVGMYLPYWTYDSDTSSSYSGARGVYYYVTESYTTTENGQTVSKTRQVRKTRWTSVRGQVNHFFDDVLIPASKTLPEKYLRKLEPWDLKNLSPYKNEYLSGFKCEKYQVNIEEGFGKAKGIMDGEIRGMVRRDIGGDEQRIYSVNTRFDDITFKHILLPLWISAYRYRNKVYRFIINARTGEVKGERPYSTWKIILAVLVGIIVIGGTIYLVNKYGGE